MRLLSHFTMRIVLALLAGASITQALAQSGYPNLPIRVVIQFAPGGSDVVARILCQRMGESLGQPMVIDNRPGAAGIIGANIVAKAAPDGYTTLFATASFAVTAASSMQLPYDSIRDFDEFAHYMRAEVDKWRNTLQLAGIRSE